MARGILEFREGIGAGRSPFKKPRVFEAVLLSAFSHLGEVCRPIDNSIAFCVKFVKFEDGLRSRVSQMAYFVYQPLSFVRLRKPLK